MCKATGHISASCLPSEQVHNNTEQNIMDIKNENDQISNNEINQLDPNAEQIKDNTITSDKNNYAIKRAASSILSPPSPTTSTPKKQIPYVICPYL